MMDPTTDEEREIADDLALARECSIETGLSVSDALACILATKEFIARTPLQREVMRRQALEKQIREAERKAERKAEQDRRERLNRQVVWGFLLAAVVVGLIALSQRPQPEAYDGQFDEPREFIR
jgi:hypothetical protein